MGNVKTKVRDYEAMLARRNGPTQGDGDPLSGNQLSDPLKRATGTGGGAEPFQVFCRTVDGKMVTVSVTQDMTMSELRGAVAASSGVPDEAFSLTFGGKALDGARTARDVGLGEHATLVQQGRVKGGYAERAT